MVQVDDTGKVSLSQILVTSGRFSKCAKINTKLLPPRESYIVMTSASLVMDTRIEFPFLSHIRILTKLNWLYKHPSIRISSAIGLLWTFVAKWQRQKNERMTFWHVFRKSLPNKTRLKRFFFFLINESIINDQKFNSNKH